MGWRCVYASYDLRADTAVVLDAVQTVSVGTVSTRVVRHVPTDTVVLAAVRKDGLALR